MAQNEPLLVVDVEQPVSRPLLKSRVVSDTSSSEKVKRGQRILSGAKLNSKLMVEQTSENSNLLPHRQDILRIEKEAVIQTSKPTLIEGLAKALDPQSAEEFKILAIRVDSTIRAWYKAVFEELLHTYRVFDPLHGAERIEQHKLSVEDVEKMEAKFLKLLFRVLDKSNYKMVTDKEYEVALDGSYMLSLPITVDSTKLDRGLMSRFFARFRHAEVPSFANQYLIFRRGLGIDQVTDRFIIQKVDMILESLWNTLLFLLCLKKRKSWETVIHDTRDNGASMPARDTISIERIHLENMRLNFKFLLSLNTIQEPTFERIILIYRPATPPEFESPLGDRTICIKHFRHIPMADMEIVLPEKNTPGLTPRDWISMAMTVLFGVIAVISAARAGANAKVFLAIIVACATYIMKLYLAWNASMRTYRALIQQSMYDKQLDSGRGTLLHICDDVLQQELKEVIVAYFLLLTTGKATKEELDRRCEMFMERKFGENVQFDVEDAVDKLVRLGIATKNSKGKYVHLPLKAATATIGLTTDEVFGSQDVEGMEDAEEVSRLVGPPSGHFTTYDME